MLLDLRDIGVLPPLGVYDPLGLIETRDMRRSKSCSARIVNSRMNSSLMFHQMHRSHLAARACDDAIICCTCASLVRNACRGINFAGHVEVRNHGDQARPRGDARIPPRDRD